MFIDDHRIRIVSHPLCPFAQSMRLLLIHKGYAMGEDFDADHIDLKNRPDWFLALSPEGRMPVLVVDGEAVTFETPHACELLDDITPSPLASRDPLTRLRDRDAVLHAGRALDALRGVFMAKAEVELGEAVGAFFDALAPVEARIVPEGTRLSPVDIAFAPLFCLALFHEPLRRHDRWAALPKTFAWGERLVAREDVRASCCDDYAGEFDRFFALFGSRFARLSVKARRAS